MTKKGTELTPIDLDNLIERTRSVSRTHPDRITRAKVLVAINLIDLLDKADPTWRNEMVIEINRAGTNVDEDFFNVILNDAAIALTDSPVVKRLQDVLDHSH